ncbi:uncharacterized protein LOC112212915 [Bombus impatiens]|uniref:Uncharacterized protein LOC112212915 n=1 Tax=Bombus impatiens TaxID=132113 RepID=A0A6P8LTU5_BOMIM|nr:uncharacterized protein LOC112212915 [Bombus impatiens]
MKDIFVRTNYNVSHVLFQFFVTSAFSCASERTQRCFETKHVYRSFLCLLFPKRDQVGLQKLRIFFHDGIAWLLLDGGLHDDFPWAITASMTTFLASYRESHAFLFLRSLNHVVGRKVRIDTGDWLYYVEFFASIVTAGIYYTCE